MLYAVGKYQRASVCLSPGFWRSSDLNHIIWAEQSSSGTIFLPEEAGEAEMALAVVSAEQGQNSQQPLIPILCELDSATWFPKMS